MATSSQLAQILHQEQQSARQLVALLQEEQRQLIDANVELLPSLTERIASVVLSMSELAAKRQIAMAENGVGVGDAEMKAWLASGAAPADLSGVWQQLMDDAVAAKELNYNNGVLIGRHLSRNQAALTILNGGNSNFYGPTGQSTSYQASRRFAAG